MQSVRKRPTINTVSWTIIISWSLISLGVILVVASFTREAINYPWSTLRGDNVNTIELPDPPPPSVSYVAYTPPGAGQAGAVREIPGFLPDDRSETESLETSDVPSPSATPAPKPVPTEYVWLGTIKIPRINIAANLFQGSEDQMHYGVGHVVGTAMPGEAGNCSVAAHRVSNSGMQPFRYLDKMQEGDIITIRFNEQVFTYAVYEQFIVHKQEVWVMQPVEDESHILTMITCDPVISATAREGRLIVRARLVSPE